MSASISQHPPIFIICRHSVCNAMCGDLLGLNPYEQSKKSCSYIGSSNMTTARCSVLSSNVGIPSGRVLPFPFGMLTLLTGGATYWPDFAFSRNSAIRCYPVHTIPDSNVSFMFPRNGSVFSARAFPPQASHKLSSPASQVLCTC